MQALVEKVKEVVEPKLLSAAVVGGLLLAVAALSPVGQWVTGYGSVQESVERNTNSIGSLWDNVNILRTNFASNSALLERVMKEQDRRGSIVDQYFQTRAEVEQLKGRIEAQAELTNALATLTERIAALTGQIIELKDRMRALERKVDGRRSEELGLLGGDRPTT